MWFDLSITLYTFSFGNFSLSEDTLPSGQDDDSSVYSKQFNELETLWVKDANTLHLFLWIEFFFFFLRTLIYTIVSIGRVSLRIRH